jgi:stearoyl-CoA desaturase (delta-9 desaturase)
MKELLSINKFIDIHRPIFFVLSIITYICLINAIFTININDWWKIFLVYYLIGCSEQIFHHRKFAHNSWKGPIWLDVIGLILSNQSLLGNSVTFASQHRLHHKFADTKLDPHSPLFFSKFRIMFLFPYYNSSIKYATDLINNKLHVFFSRLTLPILFSIWILIGLTMSFEWLFTIWLPGIALVILIKNYLNYRLHMGGKLNYKTFQINDNSFNNFIWGYLAFDGWHQNHHRNPNFWYLGNRWWEIDIPGVCIGILSILTFQFKNFKNIRLNLG